jgi:hypothetical protein
VTAPVIEPRSIAEFLREIRDTLGPAGNMVGAGEALTQVLARYAELIAVRLNQVPDKLFLEYLNFLGAALQPPEPARVPLSFYLAEGNRATFIKKGTSVEAIRGAGDKEAVTFETETDLNATAAALDTLMWKDPARDEYANLSAVVARPCSVAVPVFRTSTEYPPERTPHELWIGLTVPEKLKHLDAVRFQFRVAQGTSASRTLAWSYFAPAGWSGRQPAFDTSSGLARTGDVLIPDWTPEAPRTVMGISAHWFRCVCEDPVTHDNPAALPVVTGVECVMEVRRSGLPPERVYTTEALDATREMWVFGSRPAYGSTLYLRHDEAFGVAGAQVTLAVDLVNPRDAGDSSPVPPVRAVDTRLDWEAWDGAQWTVIGTSRESAVASDPVQGFEDATGAFTKSGDVRIRIPATTAPVTVAGESGYWIRVRIAFGGYGRDASYQQNAAGAFVYSPATLAPPLVRSLRLSFQTQVEVPKPWLLRHNDFHLENITADLPLRPFLPVAESERDPALYFGFALPASAAETALAPVELSLYFQIRGRGSVSALLGTDVAWERRDPASGRWAALPVRDHTLGLAKSGMVRSVAAFPVLLQSLFGRERIWIRLRPVTDLTNTAMIEAVLLNTVPALHVRTTENETIWSGNATPSQVCRAARSPVLGGQELQVLESSVPSATERTALLREEGPDAITAPEAGQGPGVWVRWHEVPDFRSSGPRDRHYVVDRLDGAFQFGDGVRGLAVPAGTANVRLRRYRTGGGIAGNKPAYTVINLKSSVPGVARVVNHVAAEGGSDIESLARLRNRFPRELRHRHRAVTTEDYEDLALAASRLVHRVKCVPLYDLATDPGARRRVPGLVSLIVLPRSTAARPVAPTEVLQRVQEYVGERRPPSVQLVVVSPEYVRIDIEAEVVVSDLADRSRVEAQAVRSLRDYLHPCTGQQGEGWDFGRIPRRSDLYAILEAIPGLKYIAGLQLKKVPERTGAEHESRFAIYSGDPRVSASVED